MNLPTYGRGDAEFVDEGVGAEWKSIKLKE
jgi:hypothetical protein